MYAFLLYPFSLAKSVVGQGGVVHFQGSPNSGGEVVWGCCVQCEAPLHSCMEMLLPGIQHLCPLGQAKQSPGAPCFWKREALIIRGS